MAGLFSAITAVGTLVNAAVQSDATDVGEAIRDAARAIKKNRLALTTDGSLTKFLTQFVVEPVIIVSKDAKRAEVIEKVFALNSDIFCSFYMQAFNAMTSLYGVEAKYAINLLSSSTGTFATAGGDLLLDYLAKEERKDWVADLESNNKYLNFSLSTEASNNVVDLLNVLKQGSEYDDNLEALATANKEQLDYVIKNACKEVKDVYKKLDPNVSIVADELLLEINRKKSSVSNPGIGLSEKSFSILCAALSVDHTKYKGKHNEGKKDEKVEKKIKELKQISAIVDYKNSKVADTAADNLYAIQHRELSIKVNIVNTKDGVESKHDIILPISVKTHIIATDIQNIINMLKPNDRTKSFGYRLDEYRSGSISLKELLFCGDLITQYKKNKLSDKDGLLNIIKQREESSNAKVLRQPDKLIQGFEKFYNMLIVTADEKILLNKHIGGDILNERYKQELLTEARALTISILDDDYERLYVLTKDIRGKSEASYKSIAKKKDNGVSDEMFKALLANRPPII